MRDYVDACSGDIESGSNEESPIVMIAVVASMNCTSRFCSVPMWISRYTRRLLQRDGTNRDNERAGPAGTQRPIKDHDRNGRTTAEGAEALKDPPLTVR